MRPKPVSTMLSSLPSSINVAGSVPVLSVQLPGEPVAHLFQLVPLASVSAGESSQGGRASLMSFEQSAQALRSLVSSVQGRGGSPVAEVELRLSDSLLLSGNLQARAPPVREVDTSVDSLTTPTTYKQPQRTPMARRGSRNNTHKNCNATPSANANTNTNISTNTSTSANINTNSKSTANWSVRGGSRKLNDFYDVVRAVTLIQRSFRRFRAATRDRLAATLRLSEVRARLKRCD